MEKNLSYQFRMLSILMIALVFQGSTLFAGGNKVTGGPLGLSWENIGPNNLGSATRALAWASDGSLLKGSLGGGLWRSTNGGASWQLVPGIADNLAVTCIAVDGDNIYVGTGDMVGYSEIVGDLNYNNIDNENIPGLDLSTIQDFKNGFHSYSGTPGQGVFVSTDGGSTFSHDNASWSTAWDPYDNDFLSIQKIVAKNGKVLVATLNGVYTSTNNLASISPASGPSDLTNEPVWDIEWGSGDIVYATNDQYVFMSTDGGSTFGPAMDAALMLPGLSDQDTPFNNLGGSGGRIEIAIAPSQPSTIYVTGANGLNKRCSGIWRSDDDGANWTQIVGHEIDGSSTFSPYDQIGQYSQVLEVHPTDPDNIYVGARRMYTYSPENGLNPFGGAFFFPPFVDNYIPSPVHELLFNPNNPDELYIGTDKQTIRSTDGGETFSFRTNGYAAAHMYNVSTSPSYRIIGSERYNGVIWKDNSSADPSQQQFGSIYPASASGTIPVVGAVRFSQVDASHVLAQGADGGLLRSLSGGVPFEPFYGSPIFPIHPSLDPNDDSTNIFIDKASESGESVGLYDDDGAPVTAWVFDEVIPESALINTNEIKKTPVYAYMCSRQFVWVITNPFGPIDSVPAWNRITPKLVQNRPGTDEYMTAITVSGDDDHVVYVGTSFGNIFRIFHANDPLNMDLAMNFDTIKFDDAPGYNPDMPRRWITDLAFDPNDRNNLVVTYGAYGDMESSMVYITNNALDKNNQVNFRAVGQSLPDFPVYSAAFHPDPAFAPAIILGTEYGIYTCTDSYTAGSMTWNEENDGMSKVPVYDIEFRKYYWHFNSSELVGMYGKDNTLFIATQGRGIFRSGSVVSRDLVEETVIDENLFKVEMFPNPAKDRVTLEFQLENSSDVVIELFSITGVNMGPIHQERFNKGIHRIQHDISNLSTGIYFVKTSVSGKNTQFVESNKLVIVK